MQIETAIQAIIPAIMLALILIGIWKEEKLIAFEDWLMDRAAYIVAKIIVSYRRRRIEKSLIKIEKAHRCLEVEEAYIKRNASKARYGNVS